MFVVSFSFRSFVYQFLPNFPAPHYSKSWFNLSKDRAFCVTWLFILRVFCYTHLQKTDKKINSINKINRNRKEKWSKNEDVSKTFFHLFPQTILFVNKDQETFDLTLNLSYFYIFKAFIESKEERMLMTIGEIIKELLTAHDERRDVDLNKLKTRISSKYGLESSPRLVDIIAAVPYDAKKILLPKLKAKPIRTASGVREFPSPRYLFLLFLFIVVLYSLRSQ